MFTLKLYRRDNGIEITKIIEADSVSSVEVSQPNDDPQYGARLLEIQAYNSNNCYIPYFVGHMDDSTKKLHDVSIYMTDNGSLWDRAILENSNGKTTQTFRP